MAHATQQTLNLARKWRPQNFSQVVGQDIPIRMLKNSLYLKKYFPVYLFAGQRGCGKTSTARVFAAALNCLKLPAFQEQPTSQEIPCLECSSCTAMMRGNHPDFIEIDAASNTGVDNVRQIIETASYVPLSGQKKVYLIDEAHMLSKAAFNAFLKILEEPPETVLFILATTELQKIPETVLSRCFQLTFHPISGVFLKEHLRTMCEQEKISIDDDALQILVEETGGCARDAINLLEQVRFSSTHINAEQVLRVLGKVSNAVGLTLFELLLDRKPDQVLTYLHEISFQSIAPLTLWNMLVALCRALLWAKYGVTSIPNSFSKNLATLETLAEKCPLSRLHGIMQLLLSQEALFQQTSQKHTFLEVIMLHMCEQTGTATIPNPPKQHNPNNDNTGPSTPLPAKTATSGPSAASTSSPSLIPSASQSEAYRGTAPKATIEKSETKLVVTIPVDDSVENSEKWKAFVENVLAKSDDQLLNSILMQTRFLGNDSTTGSITIKLSSNSNFFKEKIKESAAMWQEHLKQHFDHFTGFNFAHNAEPVSPKPSPAAQPTIDPSSIKPAAPRPATSQAPNTQYRTFNAPPKKQGPALEPFDVQDKEKWPLANLLTSHFPGTIKKAAKPLINS
ncbi:DNA polymerase III subunit gamma/tau [Candidatus Babeliales bacterium]|nr:DNA polymerase III subunit gamma/tau [Candidatus Babeliales bacterium]